MIAGKECIETADRDIKINNKTFTLSKNSNKIKPVFSYLGTKRLCQQVQGVGREEKRISNLQFSL